MTAVASATDTPTLGDLLVALETPGTSRERVREIVELIPAYLGSYGDYIVNLERHLRTLRDESVVRERVITALRDQIHAPRSAAGAR